MPGTGYRGDPGLFGDILGAVGKVASFVPGPVGWAGKAVGLMKGGGGAKQRRRAGRAGTKFGGSRQRQRQRYTVDPSAFLPGGQPFISSQTPQQQAALQQMETVGDRAPPAPSGWHWNKQGYYRGGRPKSDGPLEYIPKWTRLIKNRRTNPANPRAADRAITRIGKAKKFAAKLGRITIRKKQCC